MIYKALKVIFAAISIVGLVLMIGTVGAADTLSIGAIVCHSGIGAGLLALGVGVWNLADAYDDEN